MKFDFQKISDDAKSEWKIVFYSLLLLIVGPSVVTNLLLHIIPLDPTFGRFITVNSLWNFSTVLCTIWILHYLKIATIGPPLILMSSFVIWLWSPILAPFTSILYTSFWIIDRFPVLMEPKFSFSSASFWHYAMLVSTIISGICFFTGLRFVFQEKMFIRKKEGSEMYRSKSTVYGDSKWGNWDKIKPIASAGGNEIIVGEHYDPRLNANEFNIKNQKTWGQNGKMPLITISTEFESGHSLFIAGPGGAKTSAYVIPNCINFESGIIVVDPMGAVLKKVRKHREAMGRTIIEVNFDQGVDLFALAQPIMKQGPMGYFELANIFIPSDSKDKFDEHYVQHVRPFIASLLYFIVEVEKNPEPLQRLALIAVGGQESLKNNLHEILKKMNEDGVEQGDLQRRLKSLTEQGDQATTWFYQFLFKCLSWTNNDFIRENFESGNKSNMKVFDDNTDVFITFPREQLVNFGALFRSVFVLLMYLSKKINGSENPRLVIIDEASSLGYLDILKDIRDKSRQEGIHLMMIYQSLKQVTDTFGQGADDEWQAAVACYGVSRLAGQESEKISRLIGNFTADIKGKGSTSSTQGTGLVAGTIGTSANVNINKAALITPQELIRLPADSQVLFLQRYPPLLCGKALAFSRHYFVEIIDAAEGRVNTDPAEGRVNTDPAKGRANASNGTIRQDVTPHLSDAERAVARVNLWKKIVYNDPFWWRRRFRELGFSITQAEYLDILYHPDRFRDMDERLRYVTRRELDQALQAGHKRLPALVKVSQEIKTKEGLVAENEFYEYQELHPDEYIIPDYLEPITNERGKPEGFDSAINWDSEMRRCKCDALEKCVCGFRGIPLAFNLHKLICVLNYQTVDKHRFYETSDSSAQLHADRSFPYNALPKPAKYADKISVTQPTTSILNKLFLEQEVE